MYVSTCTRWYDHDNSSQVIGELCQYESICKHAREELKHTMNVREKEMARKKVLDKARERQPFNRQQVVCLGIPLNYNTYLIR